jgi:hypothetical protein
MMVSIVVSVATMRFKTTVQAYEQIISIIVHRNEENIDTFNNDVGIKLKFEYHIYYIPMKLIRNSNHIMIFFIYFISKILITRDLLLLLFFFLDTYYYYFDGC